jgi:hypothetical protein
MSTPIVVQESFEILAQLKPLADILTDLLTADDNEQIVISTLTISNPSAYPDYYYISIAPLGAADSPEQYLYQNVIINPYDTFRATTGDTLNSTDVMRCKSLLGNLSFNLAGVRMISLS